MLRSQMAPGLVALVLALAAVPRVNAQVAYTKGGAVDICAGIETSCTDVASCTRLYVGPCLEAAAGPTIMYTSSFVGLAFLNSSSNYDGSAGMYVIPSYANANNGYRDFSPDETVGTPVTGRYAYIMNGGHVGTNPSVMGAYVGVANYLCTSGKITTAYNKFYWANPGEARKQRGVSALGAPQDASDVCISPLKATGACGDDLVFNEGDMKFSIYGSTMGSNYNLSAIPVNNIQFVGFRMKYALKGVAANALSIKINGDKTLDNIGSADVSTISISTPETGEITFGFPTKYNVGTSGAQPTQTKTAKIRALPLPSGQLGTGEVAGMYLDFLFDSADLNTANKYFVYDPTVRATVVPSVKSAYIASRTTTASLPKTTPKPNSAASLTAPLTALLLAAASALLLQ